MGGLHVFTLRDIPVRVSPWYLLILVYYGSQVGAATGMLLGVCITISLLAHELGHALVARHYKLQPEILLHGLGGLTGHQRPRTPTHEALIVAAGPAAGLSLAALSYVVLSYVDLSSGTQHALVRYLLQINLIWSIFNLLPMWPMDGGQLMRLAASKIWKPERGERITHIISVLVVVAVAAVSYYFVRGPLLLVILGLTAWQNIQALSQGRAGAAPREHPFARELLQQAEAAYRSGDDDEAARLCHQLRGLGNVPPPLLSRAWAILGVTATRRGDYEEALSYLQRAPELPEVIEAKAQCLYELERFDALEGLVGTQGFSRLPAETRKLILDALHDALQSKPA